MSEQISTVFQLKSWLMNIRYFDERIFKQCSPRVSLASKCAPISFPQAEFSFIFDIGSIFSYVIPEQCKNYAYIVEFRRLEEE